MREPSESYGTLLVVVRFELSDGVAQFGGAFVASLAMALSISRCMISSFESGRFDFTSSSHSSRNAISELFAASSGA